MRYFSKRKGKLLLIKMTNTGKRHLRFEIVDGYNKSRLVNFLTAMFIMIFNTLQNQILVALLKHFINKIFPVHFFEIWWGTIDKKSPQQQPGEIQFHQSSSHSSHSTSSLSSFLLSSSHSEVSVRSNVTSLKIAISNMFLTLLTGKIINQNTCRESLSYKRNRKDNLRPDHLLPSSWMKIYKIRH